MHDMTGVRKVIEQCWTDKMTEGMWERIKAAFLAAQPPGDDDIRDALAELGDSREEEPCGLQVVSAHASDREWLMTWWSSNRPLVAAIRDLIPKPEPTWEENMKTVSSWLENYTLWLPARDTAREALDGLRKRLEEKT